MQQQQRRKFTLQATAILMLAAFGIDVEADKNEKYTGSKGGGNHMLRWAQKLDSTNGRTESGAEGCNSDRFKCIFPVSGGSLNEAAGTAVLDMETGLVWERSPETTVVTNWDRGIVHCANREVGGRKGWSLPMREQLASLVDTNNNDGLNSNGLALPAGHPFIDIIDIYLFFWSATTDTNRLANAWIVDFTANEYANGIVTRFEKDYPYVRAWCVRGGQVYDGQNVLPPG